MWNDHAEFGRQQLNRLLLVIIAQVVNGTVQWRVKSGARGVRGRASANPSEIIRSASKAAVRAIASNGADCLDTFESLQLHTLCPIF